MQISEQLALIPEQPGVYLMHGANQEVLYVGKARTLSKRVKSYFKGGTLHSPKIEAMVPLVDTIKTIITDTEVEALVLEEQLIRKFQPRYNTLLKNSKGYPYIRITWQEDYPRVEFARQRKAKDKALYYGPYPSGHAVNRLLDAIRELFPVEKCKDPRKEKQVCIYYNMHKCLGHCQKKVSSETFKQMLEEIKLFLEGKSGELKSRLEAKMQSYSSQMLYEQAAQMRDTLIALDKFFAPSRAQKIITQPHWNLDILHLARDAMLCYIQVFPVRNGILQPPLPATFHLKATDENTEVLNRFIYSHYSKHPDFPAEILLPFEPEEKPLLETWLSEKRGAKVQLKCPQRGKKKQLLDMVEKNVAQGLKKSAHRLRYQISVEGLEELKQLFDLPELPLRIDGFDISHFQGQETVASMVVFEQGAPSKQEYRRFKIKSTEGVPNDFAAMEEVVTRRYRKLKKEALPFPDLILIDGGKGQVSAAMRAFKRQGIQPKCLIGLAKKEELIVVPDQKELLRLPRHSPALRLLQGVRDESHRFALTYHRKRRSKRILKSELDDIPGVGTKRKQILLRQFGSVAKIKEASVQDLVSRGKVSRALAQTIYQFFRTSQP